jgi:hypothetical protein
VKFGIQGDRREMVVYLSRLSVLTGPALLCAVGELFCWSRCGVMDLRWHSLQSPIS